MFQKFWFLECPTTPAYLGWGESTHKILCLVMVAHRAKFISCMYKFWSVEIAGCRYENFHMLRGFIPLGVGGGFSCQTP